MRCFVAISLPDALHAHLAALSRALRAESACRAFRFVADGNAHLTLRFLGDVEEDTLTHVRGALAVACRGRGALTLHVGGLGAFPGLRRPRVLWVAVDEPTGALAALQAVVEAAAVGAGLAPETRPFAPHLTLARLRDRHTPPALEGVAARRGAAPFGAFTAQGVTLFASELGAGAPVYRVLEEFPLK